MRSCDIHDASSAVGTRSHPGRPPRRFAARGVMNAATTEGTGVMNAAATNTSSFQNDISTILFNFIMTPVQWLPRSDSPTLSLEPYHMKLPRWYGVMNAAATDSLSLDSFVQVRHGHGCARSCGAMNAAATGFPHCAPSIFFLA
ncbi:MAG: hypothetical protein M3Z24_05655 [Chloroflexota bacterium]|nr:hypothetical protein [Chloroflexota bacterium]